MGVLRGSLLLVGWLVWVLPGCGTTDTLPGCETAADCTGDPGAGCTWSCTDGTCQKLCTGECDAAADCEELSWPIDCLGHWECRDHVCQAVCGSPGCQTADDCQDLPWELQCPGHWECPDGECQAICDELECQSDGDCAELSLPCPGDGAWFCQAGTCASVCFDECATAADCVELTLPCEYGGRWECPAGTCLPLCDEQPECDAPIDCVDQVWTVRCTGHWSCAGGVCEETCDGVGCPDGMCSSEGGESATSCPQDCDRDCQSPADCQHLFWPLACEGHWECQDQTCQAVCGGADCLVDSDCLGRDWGPACVGNWDCRDGVCAPHCDPITCGDDFCDPDIGEGPETCWPDCFRPECVPEGLPVIGLQLDCCDQLVPLEDCYPGVPCSDSLAFCVDCSDGSCDPRESAYNCPHDCPEGCPIGESRPFLCPDGSQVDWCACTEGPCKPICQPVGGNTWAWVDSCTGDRIADANCSGCEAVCQYIGDLAREGWYASCPNGPSNYGVKPAACAPRWDCRLEPFVDCR